MTTLAVSNRDMANAIRALSMDAIEKAKSGHVGLPLGMADAATVLFTQFLKFDPTKPDWADRDRFVLSAGHGSMLVYSLLHLTGYESVSLDDIKNFRQLGASTPGHPENFVTPGVETTTGPLGQGIATAVGMAMAEQSMNARYGDDLVDHYTYVVAGDGCLMEGVSAEASSLAGHLKLNNLVVIYDSNDICLDGPTDECFTDDTAMRYESYGWAVQTIDGHHYDDINEALSAAKESDKPTLIIAKTTIGYGSPNRAGSSEAHGKALGDDEGNQTKEALGIPTEPLFYVSDACKNIKKELLATCDTKYKQWLSVYSAWAAANSELQQRLDRYLTQETAQITKDNIINLELKDHLASRSSSQAIIQQVANDEPNIIGGSADLSCSDSTYIKSSGFITGTNYLEQNIKYGVREFAMAAIAAGISLGQLYRPFVGTFFTFSDYMKNAIRLSALMNLPVVYQFTHDSILLGEDGPTHQPIEHLASLRSIPNLTVIRPADNTEVKGAWVQALESKNPTALVLSRQGLANCEGTSAEAVSKGAYIVKEASNNSAIDLSILATGSELALALDVANELESNGDSVRVISMASFELFDKQSKDYQNTVLSKQSKTFMVIEAQTSFGWHKYVGRDAICITVEDFGLSAPAADLKEQYGFTKEAVIKRYK